MFIVQQLLTNLFQMWRTPIPCSEQKIEQKKKSEQEKKENTNHIIDKDETHHVKQRINKIPKSFELVATRLPGSYDTSNIKQETKTNISSTNPTKFPTSKIDEKKSSKKSFFHMNAVRSFRPNRISKISFNKVGVSMVKGIMESRTMLTSINSSKKKFSSTTTTTRTIELKSDTTITQFDSRTTNIELKKISENIIEQEKNKSEDQERMISMADIYYGNSCDKENQPLDKQSYKKHDKEISTCEISTTSGFESSSSSSIKKISSATKSQTSAQRFSPSSSSTESLNAQSRVSIVLTKNRKPLLLTQNFFKWIGYHQKTRSIQTTSLPEAPLIKRIGDNDNLDFEEDEEDDIHFHSKLHGKLRIPRVPEDLEEDFSSNIYSHREKKSFNSMKVFNSTNAKKSFNDFLEDMWSDFLSEEEEGLIF